MSADEREKRHNHNYAHVINHTAQDWAETFVRYENIGLTFTNVIIESSVGFYIHKYILLDKINNK